MLQVSAAVAQGQRLVSPRQPEPLETEPLAAAQPEPPAAALASGPRRRSARASASPTPAERPPTGRGCAADTPTTEHIRILDPWPEQFLGAKPPLPDLRLASHPCRFLSRGNLPGFGRWAELGASQPPSGLNWGAGNAEENGDVHRKVDKTIADGGGEDGDRPDGFDAWGNSLAAVFGDVLELVAAGVDGSAATAPRAVTREARRRWLRALRNGDTVRTIGGQPTAQIKRQQGHDSLSPRHGQTQRIALGSVFGWYPGTSQLRLRFTQEAGADREESLDIDALEAPGTRSVRVQPPCSSAEFESFDAQKRGVPRLMERVYVSVQIGSGDAPGVIYILF